MLSLVCVYVCVVCVHVPLNITAYRYTHACILLRCCVIRRFNDLTGACCTLCGAKSTRTHTHAHKGIAGTFALMEIIMCCEEFARNFHYMQILPITICRQMLFLGVKQISCETSASGLANYECFL